MTKISGGFLKGRNIRVSDSSGLRPTTNFFRQWLFNILNNHYDFEECVLYDLFAGSGVVSLEFLSRGGGAVHAIEQNSKVHSSLVKNFQEFSLDIRCYNLYKGDSTSFLQKINFNQEKYNILFVDPPYNSDYYLKIVQILKNNYNSDLLPDSVIFEQDKKNQDPLDDELASLGYELHKEKCSGTTLMQIYMR